MSSKKAFVLVIGAFLTLLVLAWAAIGTLLSGFVVGTEFSPYSLKTRSFTYYELPIIHWQVTPIKRTTTTGPVETYLMDNGIVPPMNSLKSDQWHLADVIGGGALRQRGDAGLLTSYLENSRHDWEAWSKKHPELAQEFWPVVFRLARRNDYVLIPQLFDLVKDCDVAEDFKTRGNRLLVERYRAWATAEHDSNRSTSAVELLDEALFFAEAAELEADASSDLRQLRDEWIAKSKSG